MSVKFFIPTALREKTNGQKSVSIDLSALPSETCTVQVALDALYEMYPDIRKSLVDESRQDAKMGQFRNFAVVYLTDPAVPDREEEEDVRHLDGVHTLIGPDACLSISSAIAGG